MTDEEMMEVWFAAQKSACGFVEGIQKFGRLLRLAEREECAKVCDEMAVSIGIFCAQAIRARGEK